MMTYQVKLPVFEGPMDLLLHLIEKNEVEISNIPIAIITQQYLDYLGLAEELDLELTSEFLLMACTLLSIKARMLLPKPARVLEEGEELDPRQELVDKLLEYKHYKEKAEVFKEMESRQSRVFTRDIDEVKLLKEFPPANPLGAVSLSDLFTAYNQVILRWEKKQEVVSITRVQVTIQDKIEQIHERLKNQPAGLSFLGILTEAASKEEVITTFLALLEMCRMGTVTVVQNNLFADIKIYLKQEGGQTDVHSISG